jgi:ABC-type antimicrobial peptide transport system permease subunit
VRRLVLRDTVRLAVIGVTIGIVGALVLARLVASLLFGVTPTDPLTFTAVVAVLTSVAALAGYLPAARAARIEPMSALRTS